MRFNVFVLLLKIANFVIKYHVCIKMEKEQILEIIRNIHPSAKLPSNMDVKTSGVCLFINLKGKGVIANMQTDESAFEGWCVVLKAALPGIERVILNWDTPAYTIGKENAQKAHYNRFLMRVANFRCAYSWFKVADNRKDEVDDIQSMLLSGGVVVNYPKKECGEVSDNEKKPEAVLERKLVDLWGKECPVTDEQLPVGLFTNGKVSKENTFTPRGASQIDLWQLDGSTMHVYELKVKNNEKVGIISELMFYVCTIKNIVDGNIRYPDISNAKNYRHFKDFADAVATNKIENIIGYFTAPRFHPLIESNQLNNKILAILNANTLGIEFEYKNISHLA